MRIKLNSIFVSDQDRALRFYTEVLGFRKKLDITAGKFRWLTVVSPEEPDGTQLQLGPNDNPAAKTFQEAMFKQGIPATSFFVEDLQKEYERIKQLGTRFTMEPTKTTGSIIAVLDDTCGNLIQLTQLTWDMNKSDRAAP
jgi:predicted enzyme related to lactoylglutathione lyase